MAATERPSVRARRGEFAEGVAARILIVMAALCIAAYLLISLWLMPARYSLMVLAAVAALVLYWRLAVLLQRGGGGAARLEDASLPQARHPTIGRLAAVLPEPARRLIFWEILALLLVVICVTAVALEGPTVKLFGAATPLSERVAAAVAKVRQTSAGLPLPVPEVQLRGAALYVTYERVALWSPDGFIEQVGQVGPKLLSAAFASPQVGSVNLCFKTPYVQRDGTRALVSVSVAFTRGAFQRADARVLPQLVLADPLIFYKQSSRYAIDPLLWHDATSCKSRLEPVGPSATPRLRQAHD
jgi:hypothetical protein